MLLNGGHSGFLTRAIGNLWRQVYPPWQRHKPQWRVYTADFGLRHSRSTTLTIDNILNLVFQISSIIELECKSVENQSLLQKTHLHHCVKFVQESDKKMYNKDFSYL